MCECIQPFFGGENVTIAFPCDIPGSKERKIVENDTDVIEKLGLNRKGQ